MKKKYSREDICAAAQIVLEETVLKCIKHLSKKKFILKSGDRIAQMILCPVVKGKFKEVEILPKTVRGKKGFGSTGR